MRAEPGTVLGTRALNRALLARQLLLRKEKRPVLEVVAHLAGLQAQAPWPPYYQLWSRIKDFEPGELAGCLLDRSAVRIVVMRGTVHLVTAEDARFLRAAVQPVMDRDLSGNPTLRPKIAGIDHAELVGAAVEALAAEPLTGARLGAELGRRWPDRDRSALVHAARNLLPLVQVPPRAVWGRSGQPTFATVRQWLGAPLDPDPDLGRLVLRYLAAFGPATVMDVQAWCGLTRLGEVVDRLRPELVTFRTTDGRELFDLPDAPRPDPATPAPVRYVAEFDNLILSHADRSRVISEEYRRRITTVNGIFPGTILVGGFVRGTWRIERAKDRAELLVTPFEAISKRDTAALKAEGRRLLFFATGGSGAPEVRLLPPG
ncbi:hypothetical protein CFN78_10360 [Amycolatopsis antarctica]|uniref:Winged helix DNA-binding domain-containing protein n=1 Tax=Amycolatopsis antarctica TaxID=1854586 RepID=A0A263D5E0_9PSEU|nr:winged helix DNA-binding domain-containing protein [Amycolatopsis antarctica]OZM73258.1 hypothetical protein CFN78_10360 [Amycolatopsis antarctica]